MGPFWGPFGSHVGPKIGKMGVRRGVQKQVPKKGVPKSCETNETAREPGGGTYIPCPLDPTAGKLALHFVP